MRIKLPRTAVVILLLAASFLSYGGCNKSNGSGINGGGGGDMNLFYACSPICACSASAG